MDRLGLEKSTSQATETTFLLDLHTSKIISTQPEEDFYDDEIQYTPGEESQVIRILDRRLLPCILLTTFVLNMDRTNNSNAISDNLPQDLGFTIDTVNTATAIYSVLFSVFCLSGAVVAKIAGPSRWIPILMFAWGLVTLAHALIKDKFGYITGGCVIPATLVYLGGFYKGTELATRLAYLWGVQSVASAFSGLMASGLLQLRGLWGLEGWKWMFIVDGIITVAVAIFTWFYLPRDLIQTRAGFGGRKAWLTDRQLRIAVTRVIRDDISKRVYDKRVQWSDIKDTLTDVGIVGHLLITSIGLTPLTPLQTCKGQILSAVIKSFNFNVFVANALTAPPYLLHGIIMIMFVHHSDKTRERGYHGAFGASWQLLGWIFLWALPEGAGRGIKYFAATFLASWPYTHPLNVAWMSENTGSIGKRTTLTCMYSKYIRSMGIAAFDAQIYRADDAPDFKRGNLTNIMFAGTAVVLWIVQKYMYRYRNAVRARKLEVMTEAERREEKDRKEEKGNDSVIFKFTT
ncbi:uncharacterized protein LACBIDRAFT_248936 [Laccaria bicolor S238N-H82]|uniref:Predicted protein n=1 Tax=Laccaria bicolor (strain S238N-H82 / ATCC MYA-4686) TaxID=486041 RepID=B0D7V0_LACBS|nr:uncharacterized protein LACBIDRAFT_248936 [Laccaria bicolor S238N-H82]EDR09467.1 predicted protein [Laccaria bicolor S238N-H82]|eukprot:XP_001879816.1 predicted protein [Laccaria bicolor S238N-H82]